jgi:6-phosphogluconolactonase
MNKAVRLVQVVNDAAALAEAAAERMVSRLAVPGDRRAVCLTGGSTPESLYRLLATERFRARIPWQHVHWFWGDERFVPSDDARSNADMAMKSLLAHVPVPLTNLHRIPTDAASPQESARLYAAELRGFYGAGELDPRRPLFSVVLMGLGGDGHTASLFPGDPAVDEEGRWVVGVDRPGLEPFVPRVSLTLPALASTREMLFLVSGKSKRKVVKRVLTGEDLPAARAHAEGELVWLVDRDAAPEGENGA